MRTFRTFIVLTLLLCLVPVLSLLAAGLIARWAGCDLDLPPNVALPCTILGSDYGTALFALADFGWYAVGTLPAFVALLAGWITVEIVRAMGRPRRQPPKPEPLSASRRLRQPPAAAASRNRARGS